MKKYKFLVCCIKPVAREDSFKSPELRMNSGEAVRSHVPLGDTAVFDRNINFSTSMPSNREGRWRRRKNIFSFVKAFLCEFSLVRKIRRRKHREHNGPENKSLNMTQQESKFQSLLEEGCSRGISDVSSSVFSISTTTFSSTSGSCSSLPLTDSNPKNFLDRNILEVRRKSKPINKGKEAACISINVGVKMVLISLVFLVFWGKACAILCTSTWLLFGHRRHNLKKDKVNILEDVNPM